MGSAPGSASAFSALEPVRLGSLLSVPAFGAPACLGAVAVAGLGLDCASGTVPSESAGRFDAEAGFGDGAAPGGGACAAGDCAPGFGIGIVPAGPGMPLMPRGIATVPVGPICPLAPRGTGASTGTSCAPARGAG